jgi:hypothetical protein
VVWTEEDDSSDRDSILWGPSSLTVSPAAAAGLISNARASLSHGRRAGRTIGRWLADKTVKREKCIEMKTDFGLAINTTMSTSSGNKNRKTFKADYIEVKTES